MRWAMASFIGRDGAPSPQHEILSGRKLKAAASETFRQGLSRPCALAGIFNHQKVYFAACGEGGAITTQ